MDTSALSGSFLSWGTFLSLVTIIVGAITVWIKGYPDRGRVANDRNVPHDRKDPDSALVSIIIS